MQYNKMICDMEVGDQVEGFYILKGAYPKTASNGRPFLNATLSDESGAVDAKVWDYPGPIGVADEGKVIKIQGEVSEFRGSIQIIINKLRLAEERDQVDISRLVPVAPVDAEGWYREVQQLTASIEDGDYRAICDEMLSRHGKEFFSIPAAKSVHHGFINGLLMHTANMLRTADFFAGLYADVVDRSLLLAGTLLHDFAKAEEFTFSQLGLATDYSMKGQLLGHLVMGANEVAEIAKELNVPEEKSVLLQHMLLSHHGEPEFGAAVKPMCAESELLSLIDKVDSRMEIYREAMEELEPGEFSGRIFALEKKIYKHN
jgi:3'-5' exoribonuclease